MRLVRRISPTVLGGWLLVAACAAQALEARDTAASAPVVQGEDPARPPSSEPSPVPDSGATEPTPSAPLFRWHYVGPVLQMGCPRVVSLTTLEDHVVVIGFAPTPGGTAVTLLWDTQAGRVQERLENPVPLHMRDPHGNLSGLSARGDVMRQIVRQRLEDGAYATRIVVLPRPGAASANEPYLALPGRQAPDGALILLGSGRDRFYRINPALGSVRMVLPAEPIEVVDYDITPDGAILAMDGFERKLVWLDLDGNVLESLPLAANERGEPRFYYLSVAAAEGQAAWVGVAVRQADGTFVPEVQRVRGQLRERQQLLRGDGTLGMPILATRDGHGGVYLVDERAWLYHVSRSAVVTQVWRVQPAATGATRAGCDETRWFVTESGRLVPNLDTALASARQDLEACYAVLRQVNPQALGTIRVKLTTRDRQVVKTEVYAKDFEDLGLESCAATAFRKLRLPPEAGGQVFRLRLEFGSPTGATGETRLGG